VQVALHADLSCVGSPYCAPKRDSSDLVIRFDSTAFSLQAAHGTWGRDEIRISPNLVAATQVEGSAYRRSACHLAQNPRQSLDKTGETGGDIPWPTGGARRRIEVFGRRLASTGKQRHQDEQQRHNVMHVRDRRHDQDLCIYIGKVPGDVADIVNARDRHWTEFDAARAAFREKRTVITGVGP
jgi:hypothetical protein